MLLGAKKRTRISDEESDYNNENEVFGDVFMNVKSKGKENAGKIIQKVQKDLKRMRLDLDYDNSRVVSTEFFNSSSESSPRTPSPYTDTVEYASSSYAYHQMHQHQQQKQQSLDNTPLSSPNTHKLHRNPIRISTRSDASSSSSSTELLNPYMNINSVLYLANLTRTSHIVNELQDDLGCMEIDERLDSHINGRGRLIGNGSTSSMENDNSVNLELGHSHHHHQFQNDEYVNEGSSEIVSDYQSINAVLREAFLRRHRNMNDQI